MIATKTKLSSSELTLWWSARIGSLLSIGLLFLFLFGQNFQPAQITREEWVGLIFFPGGVIAGLTIAWWREGLGAGISLASLLAFYGAYGLLLGNPVRGWAFIAFATPAFLFLLYWVLSRSKLAEVKG